MVLHDDNFDQVRFAYSVIDAVWKSIEQVSAHSRTKLLELAWS